MEDRGKGREQLLSELTELRARTAEFSASELDQRRHKEDLKASEKRFQTLFERHNAVMLLIEPDSGKIVDANLAASRFYGYTREAFPSMNIADTNQLQPAEIANERQLAKNEERNYFIFPHRLADGDVRTVEVHSTPIDVQGQVLLFSIVHDITDRRTAEEDLKQYRERLETLVKERTAELETKNRLLTQEVAEREAAEQEREQLLVELRDALSKVKTLSGLLPICSYCKRIKNDKGVWEQMEVYIRDRSEADFSHGLCPDCAQANYSEYFPSEV